LASIFPLLGDAIMRNMRARASLGAVVIVACSALAQETDSASLLAAAERSFPESKIPVLFGPNALSSAFAAEADDPAWSAETESRILDEVARQYAGGLRYKRAQVECRTSTCVLLLAYVMAGTDGSVRTLEESLRKEIGFASAIKSEKTVMVQVPRSETRMIETTGVSAYVEIVLRTAR
jgi:hypothetical protein